MNSLDVLEITRATSAYLCEALQEFRPQAHESMAMFAIDCHPWNGILILGFLTATERKLSPSLAASKEMAVWKYYNFQEGLNSSKKAVSLGARMRELYDQAQDRESDCEQILKCCAAAVRDISVTKILSEFQLAERFRVSVAHPDSDEEYCKE